MKEIEIRNQSTNRFAKCQIVRRLFWFSRRREECCTLMDKSTAGRSLLYSTWLIEILCWSIDQTTWCSGPMQAGCVAGPSSHALGRRTDSVERYCRFNSTAFSLPNTAASGPVSVQRFLPVPWPWIWPASLFFLGRWNAFSPPILLLRPQRPGPSLGYKS